MTDTTAQHADDSQPTTPPADTTNAGATGAAPPTNPFNNTSSSPPAAVNTPSVNADASGTPTPPPTQSQVVHVEERPTDSRIAALRAMFPDYDDLILQSVLGSVNGNQDRAIEVLLGMSDPEYKGEPTPEAPVMSQTELDEQLARRLMLEDQEQQQAAWQAQQDARRPRFQQQPRPTSGQGQSQGQQGQGGDTMAEIQQQLGKFAETGKKTIGNIFSKVKAKIQEMDQPRTGQPSGTQPTWGGASTGYDPALYEQRTYQGQQHQPQPPYNTRPQQQPAYYDPNAQASYPINTAPSTSPPMPPPNVQGYDVTPEPTRNTSSPSSTAAPAATTPQADTPRPPSTGSGFGSQTQSAAPIDGGKLGLLPKRPVSLLRSQSPPALQSQHSQESQDDSDGLEYAENPFDEPKTRK